MSELCSVVLIETKIVVRGIVQDLARPGLPHGSLLDVGCWNGESTLEYAGVSGATAFGVEVFAEPAEIARERGIDVTVMDIEREPLPYADDSMDIVVVNQVFEHLKNIWRPMAEIHRVTAPGGWIVFSVPNLASLHNRVLLAFGRQPSSIRTFGPHVRGFTFREAELLLSHGGTWEIVRRVGVGFHPFPARRARWLARLWPGASHTVILVARKTGAAAAPWTALADAAEQQTHYD